MYMVCVVCFINVSTAVGAVSSSNASLAQWVITVTPMLAIYTHWSDRDIYSCAGWQAFCIVCQSAVYQNVMYPLDLDKCIACTHNCQPIFLDYGEPSQLQ
jgi:hypothetical protein